MIATQVIKCKLNIIVRFDFQNIISQNINKAHYQYDACASFWSSKADEKHHWCNVDEWTRDDYYYLAEEFSQDERYTEEITQAASTLWAQWM